MMSVKHAGLLLTLLWITGCSATGPIDTTGTTGPTITKKTIASTGSVDKNVKSSVSECTKKPNTANSVDTATLPDSDDTDVLTLSRLLDRLDRVVTRSPDSAKQLIQQMDVKFAELDPADRYEFALLITLKNANNKSLNRAISILEELEKSVKDRIVREILLLHLRNIALEKQYRSERNKTLELKKKIESLKGLEQELDKSNTRIQESLTPTPGDTQQP